MDPMRPKKENMLSSVLKHTVPQIIVTFVISAMLPAFVYDISSAHVSMFQDNITSACWYIGIAIVISRLILHEIKKYAIVRGLEVIFPAYFASFALSGAIILFFREDYSTVIFAWGLCLAIIMALLFEVFFRKDPDNKFILIPSEKVGRIRPYLDGPVLAPDFQKIPDPDSAVIVADLHAPHQAVIDDYFAKAALGGVKVYHYKHLMESITGRVRIEHLSENSFGTLTPNSLYARGKDAVDRLAALAALIVLAIPMLIVAALIRIDSPGPALFIQRRIGYRARSFRVYKFRTMYHGSPDACDMDMAAVTRESDPRITRLGAFLRRSRIDELPQIINILKGEMSWIGPRPEAFDLSSLYQKRIAFYAYRHIIKPGITGWAQVHQGHVTELDAIQRKLEYDFYYIKNFSLWLDVLIAIKTFQVMLNGYGAK